MKQGNYQIRNLANKSNLPCIQEGIQHYLTHLSTSKSNISTNITLSFIAYKTSNTDLKIYLFINVIVGWKTSKNAIRPDIVIYVVSALMN